MRDTSLYIGGDAFLCSSDGYVEAFLCYADFTAEEVFLGEAGVAGCEGCYIFL